MMKKDRTSRRLWAGLLPAVAVLVVVLLAGDARAADELQSQLDGEGYIRTWLISQPFVLASKEEFEKDLFADAGGEATLRPNGLVTKAGGKRIDWRVVFGADSVLRPAANVPGGTAVFYMSTTLTPAATGRYTLSCEYWADVIVWVDGKRLLQGNQQWINRWAATSEEVDLQEGKKHHLLVKLGSAWSQASVRIRLTDADGAPVRTTRMKCSLPVPGDGKALASYLPESLDLSIEKYRYFEPGRTARLILNRSEHRALPPGLDAALTARATILTREGKELDSFELGALTPARLDAGGITFTYRLRKADLSAFYVVQIDFHDNDGYAGRLERTFYCIEGIQKLAEEVGRRAKRFYKEKDKDEIYEDGDLAFLLLKLEELALLYDTERHSFDFGDRALEFVLDAHKRVEIMEKRIRLRPTPGLHEFAYISRVDDSAQPFYMYVPMSYRPMKAAPLIVYLHCYTPELNKIYWQFITEGLKERCEKYGYLLVAPFARSNTDFQGIGEQDVMHVLDLMLTEFGFNIDRDKIFLVGYSMGGMGAYTIASHYPDVWAGVIALCARADFYLWKNITPQDVQPWKRWLIGLEFGNDVAENFRNTPVLAFHGDQDWMVKVAQPTNFIAKLKGMGYDATFEPIRGADHWIAQTTFSTDLPFEWMEKRRRPAAPKNISFATYSLKYNKAYWATIDDFVKWGERAKMDVEVTGDNEITVDATNIAALTLDPPAKLIDRSKPVTVRAAGKLFTFDPPIKRPLRVELAPARETPLRKTPLLCGPIKDVYNTRFIFVYGTRGNPVENKGIYKKAVKSVAEWRAFVGSAQLFKKEKDPLMVRDRDLTDEQKKKCNLVLLGTPRTNSVLREIADKLPIKFDGDHTFIVGNRRYTGTRLGLNMIYPSPFRAGRYIVVKSGEYYGEDLSVNHKFDLLPDYIIYGRSLDREISGHSHNRSRCAGFFDKYWQLDEDLMWTQEAAEEPARIIQWR